MANRGGEDYLDKALDQAEKFAGKKVRQTRLNLHTYTYLGTRASLAHFKHAKERPKY
jgi:hypothetical protein